MLSTLFFFKKKETTTNSFLYVKVVVDVAEENQ